MALMGAGSVQSPDVRFSTALEHSSMGSGNAGSTQGDDQINPLFRVGSEIHDPDENELNSSGSSSTSLQSGPTPKRYRQRRAPRESISRQPRNVTGADVENLRAGKAPLIELKDGPNRVLSNHRIGSNIERKGSTHPYYRENEVIVKDPTKENSHLADGSCSPKKGKSFESVSKASTFEYLADGDTTADF